MRPRTRLHLKIFLSKDAPLKGNAITRHELFGHFLEQTGSSTPCVVIKISLYDPLVYFTSGRKH